MAKVKIKVRPSGLINGREWPEVGEVMDLHDVVAADMAAAGYLEVVKAAEKVEKRPAPSGNVEKRGARGRRNSG